MVPLNQAWREMRGSPAVADRRVARQPFGTCWRGLRSHPHLPREEETRSICSRTNLLLKRLAEECLLGAPLATCGY